jgi:hypothetical protein
MENMDFYIIKIISSLFIIKYKQQLWSGKLYYKEDFRKCQMERDIPETSINLRKHSKEDDMKIRMSQISK